MSPAQRYAAIVKALAGKPGVTHAPGTGFGGNALKVDDVIFAMLASGDEFVVKLPRGRVDALVAAGKGKRFDPRRNERLMKEWFVAGPGRETKWLTLAKEAMEFVAR